MNRPTLTIFYQLDPWNPTIGGIQTCINYLFKYVPEAFQLRLVGISREAWGIGRWRTAELHGRSFEFMPLLRIQDDNVRGLIPTTLKYTLALSRHQFQSDFLQFHRLEPSLVARSWSGHKILYIHNDIFQEIKGDHAKGGILWKFFPWAYFALERSLVGQFDQILSCNSNSVQLYQARYPGVADRVSYLRNTFDSDRFYPLAAAARYQARQALAQSMGLAEDTRFILFAGRLHPQKDPLLLIRAMAALRHPQAHLLVVGKGELEPEIRAEIKRQGLVGQVSLLGAVQQSTLADLYRLADLFVLTSAYEGLARGSLEALACGTPVVTTRSGETPSFLAADSGIVCEVREPGAIATAWAEVLQHPQGYPSSACVRVATPYEARQVIQSLYGALLRDWQAQKMASQLLLGTGNDWASGQSSQASQAGDGTINGASTGASAWVRDRE